LKGGEKMGMDVNILMGQQPIRQHQSNNTKVSRRDDDPKTFGKLLETSSNHLCNGKKTDLDLSSLLNQIQQIVGSLKLENQQVQKLDRDLLDEKLLSLLNSLPEDMQSKIEDALKDGTTFGELLQNTKQNLDEINLFALAIALSTQNNPTNNIEKQVIRKPGTGTIIPLFTNVLIANENQMPEQGKLMSSISELLQQHLAKSKTMSNQPTNATKVSATVKPIGGINLNVNQLTTESTSKLVNDQNLGNLQFSISQQAQYKLHVTPEKVAENRIVQEFQSIIQSGKFIAMKNGESQFQIKLFPEHLGKLDITIIAKHGELIAKIIASTQSSKDLIESQLHQLKNAFNGQNIQLEKIEVQHHGYESDYKEQQQDSRNDRDQQNLEEQIFETNDHDLDTESEDSFAALLSEVSTIV
jgi:flagellar hook-length control protein FliK